MTDPSDRTGDRVEEQEIVAEDLIEEVSIDGMCGVY
jgi:mycofactocin precursor